MGAGWLIAGRLLRPLDRINDTALQVGHGDLTRRVDLLGPDDEFANLARVLNTMLDRLHDSLEAHRRFAANASHELRTPLATDKAMLTVALDDPADTDFIGLAERLLISNQESIDTVEALLDLSDAQHGAIESEPVDLAVLAEEALAAARDAVDARAIRVETRLDPAVTVGDPVLWRRLVTNLLQNAVRHNRDGGTIWLRTGDADGRPFFESANTGDVLDPATMPTLVEPFTRTRGRTGSGKDSNRGLGLTIVAAIAAAHRADVEHRARAGGGLIVRVQGTAMQVPATGD
jgi:two-component system sensor histidine kinase VanS